MTDRLPVPAWRLWLRRLTRRSYPPMDEPYHSTALGRWSDPAVPPADHAPALDSAVSLLRLTLHAAGRTAGPALAEALADAHGLLDDMPDFHRAEASDKEQAT